MSFELKENVCPNRLSTCDEDTDMYEKVRLIKKTYFENVLRLDTSATSKTHERFLSSQSIGQLAILFKAITDRHEQNRAAMNPLIQQFLSKYKQIKGQQFEEDNDNNQNSFVVESYHAKLTQQQIVEVDGLLEKMECISPEELEQMKTIRLIQFASELERKCDISKEELLHVLQITKITKTSDMVELAETGQINAQRTCEEWTDLNLKIDSYLMSQMGELTINVISDRLNHYISDDSSNHESLDTLLLPKQYQCVKTIMQLMTDPHSVEQSLKNQPSALMEAYSTYQIFKQMERQEQRSLLTSYNQLRDRLREYCLSKLNYAQYIQSEFSKEDNARCGLMDYSSFEKAMSKCKLLSLNEVALLFRGCLFVQKNRIRDIIDRSEKIDYLILLDDILLRSNRPKHTTESTHENASELSRQLDKADQIIGVLAEQKDQLLYLLMTKTSQLEQLQRAQFIKGMDQMSERQSIIRQLKNELSIQKMKSQGQTKRLQTIIDSQSRALESYRNELEHIMQEINSHH